MRTWIIAPLGVALLTAACGETQTQRAATGAGGGAVVGGVVGGPVGALAGAAVGGATGAYRDKIDDTVDKQTDKVADAVDDKDTAAPATTAPREAPALSDQRPLASTDETRPGLREQPMPHSKAGMAVADLTNEEVREAQEALRELGLYDGEVDGIYGPRTIAAVGEFQAQQNLPRTRALTEETQRQLAEAAANGGAGQPPAPDQNRRSEADTRAGAGTPPPAEPGKE